MKLFPNFTRHHLITLTNIINNNNNNNSSSNNNNNNNNNSNSNNNNNKIRHTKYLVLCVAYTWSLAPYPSRHITVGGKKIWGSLALPGGNTHFVTNWPSIDGHPTE